MITIEEQQNNRSLEDHVYLNVTIQKESNQTSSIASYTETRPSTIISTGSDYQLAVVRFTIPPGNIPMYIFQIEEGSAQNDPDLGVMKFTLDFGGTPYTENVIFIPDGNTPIPNPPSLNPPSFTQVDSEYYYVYTQRHLLTMFNIALADAFLALKTANPGAPQTTAPFFKVDDQNKLILVHETSYNDAVNPILIYFNQDTERWFSGFYLFFDKIDDDRYARFETFADPLFDNGYEEFGVVPVTPPLYLQHIQQYNNVSTWVSLNKIVFRTSLIPIRQEYIASSNTEGQDIVEAILTDFDVSGWKGDRDEIMFFPQAPYRFIDILSQMPLRSFDISIFWEDLLGVLRPVKVFGRSIDMKLAFIKKHLVS